MAKIAVMGGGGGGQTIAADLTLDGHSVRLFEHPKFAAGLRAVRKKGGITASGSGRDRDFAKLDLVTPTLQTMPADTTSMPIADVTTIAE